MLVPLLLSAAALARPVAAPLALGPSSGDVTDSSAVIWAAAPGAGTLEVRVVAPRGVKASGTAPLGADQDFTASILLTGLRPGQATAVSVRWTDASGARSAPETIRFRTAPQPSTAAPVRLAWSGDLGGQGRCRRVRPDGTVRGYDIFDAISATDPDFFLMNGDQIYADSACPAQGPEKAESAEPWVNLPGDFADLADAGVDWTDRAAVAAVYRGHWVYNLADAHYKALMASTSRVIQWDDHEVINDFGAQWSTWGQKNKDRQGFPLLVEEGRAALYRYNPLPPALAAEGRLYRRLRWGADVELFIVDARSYRSPNAQPDTEASPKTLLGEAQRAWLIDGLTQSDATWKIVSVDVPLSAPTGSWAKVNGRDGWANGAGDPPPEDDAAAETGFEREAAAILGALEVAGVKNLVLLSTDVHFAQIARYAPDLNKDGTPFVFYEMIAGPLSASSPPPTTPDPSFSPTVLFSEGERFSFGTLAVARGEDGKAALKVEIHGEDGTVRPGGSLTIQPE